MITYKRTHTCGELRASDEGKSVRLSGWVNRRRDLGGLIFIDIRDRYGMTQVYFDPNLNEELFKVAERLKSEYVITVLGTVRLRPEGMKNESMPTGAVEIHAEELTILNEAAVLPYNLNDYQNQDENMRMKYRYLDLRCPQMAERLKLRHKAAIAIRRYLDANNFLEIETPTLMNSTPEGARDYLVPSRVHPGKVYALPQSPQLFKQLLMVGGMDRYFQIARCYRDEDLRADRQPEFTQIDMELSFITRDELFVIVEGLVKSLFEETLNVKLEPPFPRMSWQEAFDYYGTDKPDIRFGIKIQNPTHLCRESGFKVFDSVIASGGEIRAIVIPNAGKLSGKERDKVIDIGKSCGLAGVVTLAYSEGVPKSPLTKFLSQEKLDELKKFLAAGDRDLVLFAAGEPLKIIPALGKLRLEMISHFSLKPSTQFAFLWVTEFPMFSFSEEEQRIEAEHHAFTSPLPEDEHLLESEPLKVRSNAYDLVLNGVELGSGSIRIHSRALQERIFKVMGLTQQQAIQKFGFLLKAFEYGAPPHGGIALGFDRLVALMAGQESIREVLAFPKNHQAICPLTSAPMKPTEEQLNLLKIRFYEEEKDEKNS